MNLITENQMLRFNQVAYEMLRQHRLLRFGPMELHLNSLHLARNRPADVISEHQHPDFEMIFIEQGGQITFCQQRQIECSEDNGLLLLMPPSTLHRRRFASSQETYALSLPFQLSGDDAAGHQAIQRFLAIVRKHGYAFKTTRFLYLLLHELPVWFAQDLPLAVSMLEHAIFLFLECFLHEYFSVLLDLPAVPAGSSAANHEEIVSNICRILQNQLNRKPYSLAQMTQFLNLSSRQLNRIFQNATGMSIGAYRQLERLKNAEMLLSATDTPIGDISNTLGFANACQFSDFFRKKRGLSPTAFRSRNAHPASPMATDVHFSK